MDKRPFANPENRTAYWLPPSIPRGRVARRQPRQQGSKLRRGASGLLARRRDLAPIVDDPAVGPGVFHLGLALPAPDEIIGFDVLPDHALVRHGFYRSFVLENEDVIAAAHR